MRKRIAKWYLCFFLLMITVMLLRSTYFTSLPKENNMRKPL